jgi:hypothetical protein
MKACDKPKQTTGEGKHQTRAEELQPDVRSQSQRRLFHFRNSAADDLLAGNSGFDRFAVNVDDYGAGFGWVIGESLIDWPGAQQWDFAIELEIKDHPVAAAD